MTTPSPWAVLKCKFSDHPEDAPIPDAVFSKLFTTAGAATWNMPRYFADMSHGELDLSGSRVFGWLTLDAKLSDYTEPSDPPPDWKPKLSRDQLVQKALDAAKSAGIDLKPYGSRVVITFNVAIGGAFAVGNAAVGDYRYVQHNGSEAFGHEMAHVYGLNHSRRDGSLLDYQDPYDVMSALASIEGPDPDYGSRGPGINAANMASRSWLAKGRVWKPYVASFTQQIHLRPLHRRDLPGYLAIELPPLGTIRRFVEYRQRADWDAGFARHGVFVHELRDSVSYLMASTAGHADLQPGDQHVRGGGSKYAPKTTVKVLSIDPDGQGATVEITHRAAKKFPLPLPGKVLGQLIADGGGVIITGPRPEPVPPWNPIRPALTALETAVSAEAIGPTALRLAARRAALVEARGHLDAAIAEIDDFGAPAPAQITRVESQPCGAS